MVQGPSDEGASPKTAEGPEETTGGEVGSDSSGRETVRRTASSSDTAPVSPIDEPNVKPAAALEPSAPEEPASGVNRVETVDSPLRLPETWSAAKGKGDARRIEISHEIDSLLHISTDRPRDDQDDPAEPTGFDRIPYAILEEARTTNEEAATVANLPDVRPAPSPGSRDLDRATRNGQNHAPSRPAPPHSIPVSNPRDVAPAATKPAPLVEARQTEAAKGTSPVLAPPRAASAPKQASAPAGVPPTTLAPAPKENPPVTVPMGIDSVSDGKGSPTISEPTPDAPAPVVEKHRTNKQKAVVGSRSRKWLAWFLGNAAHVEGVVTPVPELGAQTTQVTLREMVPSTAYARVLFNTGRARHHYVVLEPPLDERETRSLEFIKEVLLRTLDIELEIVERSVAPESLQLLDERVRKVVRDYRMDLSQTSLRRLVYYLRRDFTGYGPVDVMMHDPDIEDISCDGPGTNVFLYHRRYGSMESNVMFVTAKELDGFVIRMAQRSGKQITIADPLLDSSLPDGSRLQATLGREVTDNGSTFTIRRFRDNPLSPIDLVRMGTMSADLLAYCWIVVQFGANVMLAGGTASGKTTTLNTISLFIPRQAKIVSIEDTREINLPHKNWVRSVTRGGTRGNDVKRVDMFDLLTAALRQRPEYILVGEVRGKEATVAFQAMATGHTVLGTIHADSPRSVVYRLESEPINIPRIVIQSLDVILMQALLTVNGRRQRRIQEVAEIVGIDPASKELLTHGVFLRNPTNDQLHYTGRSYKLQRIAQRNNWSANELDTEMKRRAQIITALVGMPNVTFDQIGQLFSTYENRPDAVDSELDRLRAGAPNGGIQ